MDRSQEFFMKMCWKANCSEFGRSGCEGALRNSNVVDKSPGSVMHTPHACENNGVL